MPHANVPEDIKLRRKSRLLSLRYPDQTILEIPFELLRVYSPSAEVRGHGAGQAILQTGKKHVEVVDVEPVGNYALRLFFSDGHDSGIYTWDYLAELGRQQEDYWRDYLQRLEAAGGSRDPGAVQQTFKQ